MSDTTQKETVKVTVREASNLLGISAEAVRQRIGRNTIPHTKIGTTVYVELDREEIDRKQHDRDSKDQDALIGSLKDQVSYLREQLDIANDANREHRRIIAGLLNRIPELPHAPQPDQDRTHRESREDATQATSKDDARDGHHEQQRPFWKRLFG